MSERRFGIMWRRSRDKEVVAPFYADMVGVAYISRSCVGVCTSTFGCSGTFWLPVRGTVQKGWGLARRLCGRAGETDSELSDLRQMHVRGGHRVVSR